MTRRASRRAVKSRRRADGHGIAWLIFDAGGELFQYQCFWMGGHCDDHLLEQSGVVTDADAVAWAAARTPQARIRMPDHLTYWAGTGPRPTGFARSWEASRSTAKTGRTRRPGGRP